MSPNWTLSREGLPWLASVFTVMIITAIVGCEKEMAQPATSESGTAVPRQSSAPFGTELAKVEPANEAPSSPAQPSTQPSNPTTVQPLAAGIQPPNADAKPALPPSNPSIAKPAFTPSGNVGFAIGDIAPEIEGPDLDGETFRLSDYRGKVVVLDFWGDW